MVSCYTTWGLAEISPEHDGGHSVDGEEEPDDEGVAVEQHAAVLQDGRQSGDRDGQLNEASDEPGHPVDRVVQTHHLHHLKFSQASPFHFYVFMFFD